MNNEVALTPATKVLWANRPAAFVYPERDRPSLAEIKADRTAYLRLISKSTRRN